jgi:molybdenum cofactor synthesis domain-containing protein
MSVARALVTAHVITVSDGVSSGAREDVSGDELERLLAASGFEVERNVVPDEESAIVSAIQSAATRSRLVLTTGGTGLGPRDVTPEATALVLEREAPGLTHLILARGLAATPMAALSRARAGSIGSSLVVNLPGSPKGAVESLAAIIDVLPHALALLAGDTEHL